MEELSHHYSLWVVPWFHLFFALLTEDLSIITQIQPSIYLQILYLVVFATALTMFCQTTGQKYTSECNASLILSLESVFGVAFFNCFLW